jgi:hypothetical protein
MSRRFLLIAVGALALIGAIVVVLNVGVNLGAITSCDPAKESFVVSPDGEHSVILAIEQCGTDRRQLTARLLPSNDLTPLFSAVAPGSDLELSARWSSASELEIIYPQHINIRHPSRDMLDAQHDYGAVKVRYLKR